jgi:ankyrin repeat protein
MSLLLEAICKGQTEVVRDFLSRGVDVNQTDEDGNTFLIMATRHEQTDIARLLVEHQADIYATNNEGQTAWTLATFTGNSELIELLIQQGVDVNTKIESPDWEGFTALMIAAYKGNAQLVHFLIEHGAEIEAKMHYGWTALMLAASGGNLNIVQYLLEQGADIHAKDPDNQTALFAAVRAGHNEIVEYLIEKGSPVDSRYQDWPALMWAVKKGILVTVKLLIEKGTDTNATVEEGSWKGFTPLMLAVYRGHTGITHFLIEHGADINARDEKGLSVLMWATIRGYLDIVEILADYGADLKAKDQKGQTAETYAHRYCQREILSTLIEKGAKSPFYGKSKWLTIGRTLYRLPKVIVFVTKTIYEIETKKKSPPPPPTPQESQLQQANSPGTINLRWSCEIPKATCIAYGNWEGDGNQKILIADSQKCLYMLDTGGNITNTLTLPTQFSYIECGWRRDYGVRLLGISIKRSKVYVIDHYGKTLWRYSKWLGIDGAHWVDLNGDGNNEVVLNGLRGIVALTDEGRSLWKVSNISNVWNQAIVPPGPHRQALVMATEAGGTIKIYNHSGKLLRTLRPEGLYFHSMAVSVIDSSRTIQIAATGSDQGEIYQILTFDLGGNVAWKTRTHRPSSLNRNITCGDINGDGIPEWVFIESPGDLVVVSPQGKKLATLSGQENIEEFIIVPASSGFGLLVTLQNGTLNAYQFEKNST